jgi:hypothetical protein
MDSRTHNVDGGSLFDDREVVKRSAWTTSTGIARASAFGDAVGVPTVLRAAAGIYLLAALFALGSLRGAPDPTEEG